MATNVRNRSAIVLMAVLLAGCTAQRMSRRPTIADCDYAVITEEDGHGYASQAQSILSQSFVVLDEYDPRLREPGVRRRTCAVSLRWRRGFWYTPVWAEVSDFDRGEVLLRTEVRGPGLWSGVSAAVPLALQDIVAARAAAGPVYTGNEPNDRVDDVYIPETGTTTIPADPPAGSRSKSQRLRELNQLRDEGLISEREYEEQRSYILREW